MDLAAIGTIQYKITVTGEGEDQVRNLMSAMSRLFGSPHATNEAAIDFQNCLGINASPKAVNFSDFFLSCPLSAVVVNNFKLFIAAHIKSTNDGIWLLRSTQNLAYAGDGPGESFVIWSLTSAPSHELFKFDSDRMVALSQATLPLTAGIVSRLAIRAVTDLASKLTLAQPAAIGGLPGPAGAPAYAYLTTDPIPSPPKTGNSVRASFELLAMVTMLCDKYDKTLLDDVLETQQVSPLVHKFETNYITPAQDYLRFGQWFRGRLSKLDPTASLVFLPTNAEQVPFNNTMGAYSLIGVSKTTKGPVDMSAFQLPPLPVNFLEENKAETVAVAILTKPLVLAFNEVMKGLETCPQQPTVNLALLAYWEQRWRERLQPPPSQQIRSNPEDVGCSECKLF